jgi:hypothetical protein
MFSLLKWVLGEYKLVCCENAHRCNKEQACLKKSKFSMWFGASSRLTTMCHPFNVGSDSHFDKACSKTRCLYLNEFIDIT